MSKQGIPRGNESVDSVKDILESLLISRGANDLLIAEDGREYIDLFAGCGTVFLGHANPVVTAAVQKQLDELWNTGALQTTVRVRATEAVESFLPSSHRVAALYSTGMEAAEFALRVSRVATGRRGVISFDGCMHGKSTAMAFLGWPNDLVRLPDFIRLPYISHASEEQVLSLTGDRLASETISAVFVEPLQGSSGGHLASNGFFRELARMCRDHGTLLVVDEIFSGFYRTGAAFLFEEFGIAPDIILLGKAMGNGFPVSAVAVDRKYPMCAAMLPGSTFAGNPLACAAITATLSHMKALDLPASIGEIGRTISREIAVLADVGVTVRGKGALWILGMPEGLMNRAVRDIFQNGVAVSVAGPYMRLLPPATIHPARLSRACGIVREAIQKSCRGAGFSDVLNTLRF